MLDTTEHQTIDWTVRSSFLAAFRSQIQADRSVDIALLVTLAKQSIPAPSPAISVVMPVWNRAHVVADALNSIFRQSYAPSQVIVCDDGSTDQTVAVIRKTFAAQLESGQLLLLEQPHKGVSAARNRALAKATGDLIAYLDSDNVWIRHYLLFMAALFSDNADLETAYTGMRVSNKDAGKKYNLLKKYDRKLLLQKNYIDLNVFVHRRALLDEFGKFNEELTRLVDWDFVLSLTHRKNPAVLPYICVDYHIDKNKLKNISSVIDIKSNKRKVASLHRKGRLHYRLKNQMSKNVLVAWQIGPNARVGNGTVWLPRFLHFCEINDFRPMILSDSAEFYDFYEDLDSIDYAPHIARNNSTVQNLSLRKMNELIRLQCRKIRHGVKISFGTEYVRENIVKGVGFLQVPYKLYFDTQENINFIKENSLTICREPYPCSLGYSGEEDQTGRSQLLTTEDFLSGSSSEETHADIFKKYLMPRKGIVARASKIKKNLGAKIMVGVHIRRTDYRGWRNGKHFFAHNHYLEAINLVKKTLPDCVVVVVSDEPVPNTISNLENVYDLPGNAGEDMILLAHCDIIISTISTFSMSARSYGSVLNSVTPKLYLVDSIEDLAKGLNMWLADHLASAVGRARQQSNG